MRDSQLILSCDASSTELAEHEVGELAPAYGVLASLAPGVLVIDMRIPWSEVAAAWGACPPIFVRHICPVHVVTKLAADEGDLERMVMTVRSSDQSDHLLGRVAPDASLSVQTRVLTELPYKPFDINSHLAAMVTQATGVSIDVRAPGQVLSVVCASLPIPTLTQFGIGVEHEDAMQHPAALIGISRTAENISDWAGGMRRFAREADQISRAEFKLLEALEVFRVVLPARGTALDLGASPGGWTRVLRRRGQYVTAVDPGQLDPRLRSDRGVRYLSMTAEAYLHSEPDRFDLIVNDMRMDARDSARLMVAYAGQLYPHGIVLMTLKLPEARRGPVLAHALDILRERYTIAGARQLFHNRSEITVYLKPK